MPWDAKKINEDFLNDNNIGTIWDITKYYLMDIGLKNRNKNVSEKSIILDTVPSLGNKTKHTG